MKIGYVGAGKVGFSLGKYFSIHGADIGGFYSKNPMSANMAADFTCSRQYNSLEEILSDNEVLFLTVPDCEISSVWNQIKVLPSVKNKIICHCSGALSSDIFSDAEKLSVYGFSVHPIFAFYSKTESYKHLSEAIFTIEGSPQKLDLLSNMISSMGNRVQMISRDRKTKYHAALVMVSNQVSALIHSSLSLLNECGFSSEEALKVLIPLISGNLVNIAEAGTIQSLTGPIERNDLMTIQKHLDCLEAEQRDIYRDLSRVLIKMAKMKHPDRIYDEIEALMK